MCRPLTDSRCVRPLRRIASASSSSTAFWSPVASAMAIPAGLARQALARCGAEGRSRARSRPCGSAGCDDGHRPERLADRADPLEPGVAREIVGAGQRHRRRRREPGAQAGSRRPARCRRAACPRRSRPAPAAAARRPPGASVSRTVCLGGEMIDATRPGRRTRSPRGRSSRGCATHAERAQTRAQPSVAASANQPSARPARPLPSTKPTSAERGGHAQESGPLPAARRARTRRRCRCRSRRRTTAEAARARPRGAFPAPRAAAENRVFQ